MSRILHNSVGCWVVAALMAGVAHRACSDEVTKESTARSSSVSRAVSSDLAGEKASQALAVTKREEGDGTRIVQVIEEDTMIRISQRPGKGITVIVVETVRDAEKVSRYTAPNVMALKARHPRGYEFYERYVNSDPLVAGAKADSGADKTTSDAGTDKARQMLREQLARYEAQIRRMQQQMQQRRMTVPQQGLPQSGFQQGGAAAVGGAWARSSARSSASSSASSSSSVRSNGSSSQGSSQSGRGR